MTSPTPADMGPSRTEGGDAAAPAAAFDPASGPDFYIDNGLYVFTAAHHLRRGWCCGRGCRHCPYEPLHREGNTKVRR
jgi:hypothetical protein